MDEAEWPACDAPAVVFGHLSRMASDRKRRLYLCAVCRYRWRHVRDERLWRVVEAAEAFADGKADGLTDVRQEAATLAADAEQEHQNWFWNAWPGRAVTELQIQLTSLAAAAVLPQVGDGWHEGDWADCGRLARSAELLRCLFGNLFRPIALAPDWLAWNAGTIPALARAAYDQRTLPAGTLDPTRLAVLADALEDAGCPDEAILGHLRGPGPHLRGCHILDTLLGLE
jgi:hypothetical protein